MFDMIKEKSIGQLWQIVSMTDVINGHFYIIVDETKRTLDKKWTICWINFDAKALIEEWSNKDMEDDIFISEANSQP